MAPIGIFSVALQLLAGGAGAARCFPQDAQVDEFRTKWFCDQLKAAQEGLLSGEPTYRFSYIPSLHPTRVVVVSKAEGRLLVVGKVLDGKGGYTPGKLASTTRRILRHEEWRLLEQRLENAGLWEAPERDGRRGADGSEWVLEGRRDGRYSFRSMWSPTDRSFPQYRKVCEYMLDLAGIGPPVEDLY